MKDNDSDKIFENYLAAGKGMVSMSDPVANAAAEHLAQEDNPYSPEVQVQHEVEHDDVTEEPLEELDVPAAAPAPPPDVQSGDVAAAAAAGPSTDRWIGAAGFFTKLAAILEDPAKRRRLETLIDTGMGRKV